MNRFFKISNSQVFGRDQKLTFIDPGPVYSEYSIDAMSLKLAEPGTNSASHINYRFGVNRITKNRDHDTSRPVRADKLALIIFLGITRLQFRTRPFQFGGT